MDSLKAISGELATETAVNARDEFFPKSVTINRYRNKVTDVKQRTMCVRKTKKRNIAKEKSI
jgi:hypothetical protein